MIYDPKIHHRRSIRLPGYDYSQAGAYFVTICTHGREWLFSEIVNGEMRLNQFGVIVQSTWNDLENHVSGIELGTFTMIIVNAWYVHDVDGYIYSLRARAYIGRGSAAEKLAFLQQLANIDYLIARPFKIPKRYWIEGNPVTHKSVLDIYGAGALFEDIFKALNNALPSQTPFEISSKPLICVTPLLGSDDGSIRPHFSSKVRR